MASEPDGDELTIDELARETGMTVRNLRAHQSRGLLPPPRVRGRTGYYDAEHVARVALIQELQAQGFNLEAIRHLVQDAGGSSGEVLRFTREVRRPFAEEDAAVVELADLVERWGSSDQRLLDRAVKMGLLRPLGEGRYEEVSPALARAGREIIELGIPIEHAMAVVAKARKQADTVARNYVRLFLDDVWKPFDAAGRPEERWPEVSDALERLRPLAGEVLMAMFSIAMTEAIDQAFGREMARVKRRT